MCAPAVHAVVSDLTHGTHASLSGMHSTGQLCSLLYRKIDMSIKDGALWAVDRPEAGQNLQ